MLILFRKRVAVLQAAMLFFVICLFTYNLNAAETGPSKNNIPSFEFNPELSWLNVSRPLTLKELKGKVVILDFWTYGCINCVHVLADLKKLEHKYPDHLAIIGVHSPKFDNEKNLASLRNIVVRYDIEHPVVNDTDFLAAQYFGMRAWPTQVIIDPAGVTLGKITGEGHYEFLDRTVSELLEKHAILLNSAPLPIALEKDLLERSMLAAPGKIAVSDKLIAISDTLHHRIILTNHEGSIQTIYGGKDSGKEDGDPRAARFHSPQGVVFGEQGLFVADTGNHLIRYIDFARQQVKTIAGGGGRRMPRFGIFNAMQFELRSPWDLALENNFLYIAMAGSHQIWRLDLSRGVIEHYAGSGREGIEDGTLNRSTFSQPSGLSLFGKWLYVADAESSAIRRINLKSRQVETLVGKGLFDFGDRDGAFEKAELQHTSGVAAIDNAHILISDTYNHKIKSLDLNRQTVVSLVGTGEAGRDEKSMLLNEPGGLSVMGDSVLIADTNNHRIMKYDLERKTLTEWKLHMPDDFDVGEGTPRNP